MCRYATTLYRQHYACLPCRKAWKGPWPAGVDQPTCSACGEVATTMGRDFKPPKRRNEQQWRKLELLVSEGITFDSCGCGRRADPPPRTLAQARRAQQQRR